MLIKRRYPVKTIFFATIFIAAILAILPVPHWFIPYRPEWIALILIYWSMAHSEEINIGTAWTIGLLADVLLGSLLGLHALCFSIIVYASIRFHARLRVSSLAQQMLFVGVILLPYMLIMLWVDGMLGRKVNTIIYFTHIFSSILIWPWLFLFLRTLRLKLVI